MAGKIGIIGAAGAVGSCAAVSSLNTVNVQAGTMENLAGAEIVINVAGALWCFLLPRGWNSCRTACPLPWARVADKRCLHCKWNRRKKRLFTPPWRISKEAAEKINEILAN